MIPGMTSMIGKKWLYPVALFACALAVSGQDPMPRRPHPQDEDKELPKKQRDMVVKEDYQKNLDDSRAMVRLAEALRDEIEKNEQYIVSMTAVKKAEEIEKLSKRIRSRMKRY